MRAADQAATDHGDRGGEVEVELYDDLPLIGAAAEFAVAVHPGVGALHGPALPSLDRCGHALGRDAGGPRISSGSRVLVES